jgi:hypothetical protein
MVELKPSCNKLVEADDVVGPQTFDDLMSEVRFRYVDLIARGSGKDWRNNERTVVFEVRSPSMGELVALTSIVANLKPTKMDYMYGAGEHCIVYVMKWSE